MICTDYSMCDIPFMKAYDYSFRMVWVPTEVACRTPPWYSKDRSDKDFAFYDFKCRIDGGLSWSITQIHGGCVTKTETLSECRSNLRTLYRSGGALVAPWRQAAVAASNGAPSGNTGDGA